MAVVVAALAPASAQAHLADIGLGPVYDGLAHPLTTPGRLLPLLGLSLLAALAGREYGRRLFLLLPAAWLAGSLAGLDLASEPEAALALGVFACVLGVAGAADMRPPITLFAAMSVVAGVCLGLLDGAAVHASGVGGRPVIGIAMTVAAVVIVVAGHGAVLAEGASRIGLRVACSWIAAAGVLSVGWALRAARMTVGS